MQLSYEDYLKEVNSKIELLPNEESEIVSFLYQDNWSVKDCCNHIDSVRRFNKTVK